MTRLQNRSSVEIEQKEHWDRHCKKKNNKQKPLRVPSIMAKKALHVGFCCCIAASGVLNANDLDLFYTYIRIAKMRMPNIRYTNLESYVF